MTSNRQQESGFTRRTLLRNGFLAGVGTAAVVGASVPLAGKARAAATVPASTVPASTVNPATPAPEQFSWVYCDQCAGMFYCGTARSDVGYCPIDEDDGKHASTKSYASYDYGFYYDAGGTNWQENWFYCRQCNAMFWGKGGNNQYGVCPSGEGKLYHDGSVSYKYVAYGVPYGGPPLADAQGNWLWCQFCSGLFYGGTGGNFDGYGGICPIDNGDVNGDYNPHDGSTSNIYYIPWNGTELSLGP